MRKFNDFEKDVLRFFVSGQKRSLNYILINMYGDLFSQRKVVYDLNDPNQLTFYRQQQDLSMDELLQTERMIIDISFLIEYLKRENLIHFFQQGNGLTSIGSAQNGANWRAIGKALDPTVSTILQEAMNQCVIASQDLIDLVDNNFQTTEDINLTLTKEALAVSTKSYKIALAALLVAIIIPIIAAIVIPVTINGSQFKEMIESIRFKKDSQATPEPTTNQLIPDSVISSKASQQPVIKSADTQK